MTRSTPGHTLVVLLLSLATGAFGCATADTELPHPRGDSMGDGMYRLVDPQAARADERVDRPWAPNPFYPQLETSRFDESRERDGRIGQALRARGNRPLPSRSSSAAAAWMFFKFYSNTWSRADGSTCRFAPTCSGFGRQAIATHGLLGLPMTFGRLHRNHSDASFYAKVGPRLADPLALHDFWFRAPSSEERAKYPGVDLYLRLQEARKYTLPEPPRAP